MRKGRSNKKILIAVAVAVLVLGGLFVVGRNRGRTTSTTVAGVTTLSADASTATADVNQSFVFQLQNAAKEKLDTLSQLH